ncbi:hypothetical protein ACTQY8_08800, partial [Collinsella bouchesdurhonensis]|uniref:hypothetical protein n=1 Tax=Collinsella bouchesdurhonensis TaxID=1907654 RepID=UPI003F92E102
MLFSNSVVDEFCEEATLPEMRAVEGLLARQMEVRAANCVSSSRFFVNHHPILSGLSTKDLRISPRAAGPTLPS